MSLYFIFYLKDDMEWSLVERKVTMVDDCQGNNKIYKKMNVIIRNVKNLRHLQVRIQV